MPSIKTSTYKSHKLMGILWAHMGAIECLGLISKGGYLAFCKPMELTITLSEYTDIMHPSRI